MKPGGCPFLQEILTDLGHCSGNPSGSWDSNTAAAARSFLGLGGGAPVQNDPAFRKRLFASYMAGSRDIDVPASRFMEPGYMGCGEFNRMATSEEDAEQDRRVTFFFFHPDRLPHLPCAFVDVGPCHHQMVTTEHRHSEGFRCSFYDSLSRDCGCEGPVMTYTLRIRLFDALSRPIQGAPYRLTAGGHEQAGKSGSIAGVSPADGSWVEAILPDQPGSAIVEWALPGDEAAENAPLSYRLEIHLDWSASDDSDQAAERWLHHLGYSIEASLTENVRAFQIDYGIDATGDLDEQTRSKLKAVHNGCNPQPSAVQS
jgi:hypothetical protein